MVYSIFSCQPAYDEKIIVAPGEEPESVLTETIIDTAKFRAHGACKQIATGFKTFEEAEESEAYADPPDKMPSDHELLLHFGIEEVGSPGLVVDEARAKASPCSCFTYKGKDMCWSKGIIGMLARDQQDIYCVAGKAYEAQPALTRRYETFAAAAEEAHKKIEAMPSGIERLEAWLGAMGEELAKQGIEV